MILKDSTNIFLFYVIVCGCLYCKAAMINVTESPISENTQPIQEQRNVSALELATQLLWVAVDRNDPVGARDAIGSGANIGWSNDTGCTPLHRAVAMEHLEVASVLLRAGADLEAVGSDGDRPLHGAANLGRSGAVALLAVAGADLSARSRQGMTPLLQATTSGNNATADLIRSLTFLPPPLPPAQARRASRVVDEEATQALTAAYTANDIKAFRSAVEKGADLDRRDSEHFVLLHKAAETGRLGMVEILLEAGAAVDPVSKSGNTPLHYAAINGKEGVVVLLVRAGADINAVGYNGFTPIQKAKGNGRSSTVALLQALGAKH